MKKDICNRDDLALLFDTCYDKVRKNKTIGYIFNDAAKVDWAQHLPKMYSFWASMLLGEQSYTGNPMIKHVELSKLTSLTDKEFSEWVLLFTQTADELFAGEIAEEAKTRAENIARLMLYKIQTV